MGSPHLFILLIAFAVALLVWGVAQAIAHWMDSDRQRLQQRLSSEWRSDVGALHHRSVRMNQPELRGVPEFMAKRPFFQRLNRKLLYAFPEAKLTRFLAFTLCLGMIACSIITLAMDSILMGVGSMFACWYAPFLVLKTKSGKRQRLLGGQIPEALDFLSRILKAGHSLSTGIQMMGDELPNPIGIEFRRTYDQHSLGQSLENALKDMANRIDSPDFAFFVSAVLIQRQTGGDLSEVLKNISTMVRARIRLEQHVKAITAEGRLTGYILVAFPMVLFVISYALNPGYAGILLRDEMGRQLLAAAVGLQLVGLYFIKKIITVKV
jgi:tight adherence protein B